MREFLVNLTHPLDLHSVDSLHRLCSVNKDSINMLCLVFFLSYISVIVNAKFSCIEPLKNVTALLYTDESSNNYTINTLLDYQHELQDINKVEVEPINVIPKLCKSSISDFPQLKALGMILNGIEVIEPGAFLNLPNLKELRLSYNRLTEISKGIFNGMSIVELYLPGNRIYNIESEAFDNMTHLKVLDLSFNHIQLMDNAWFQNSPQISTLNLMFNLIPELDQNSFKHLNGSGQKINLWFMNNSISNVHREAFNGINEIGKLSLEGNRIRFLDDQLFSQIKHIDSIHLEHNEIFCLSDRLLNGTEADEIYLNGNPIICNCMAKMERWGIATNTKTYNGLSNLNKCGLKSKFVETTTKQPEGVLVEL